MSRLTRIQDDVVYCKNTGTYKCITQPNCLFCKDFINIRNKLARYEDLEEQLMESAEIDIDSMVGEFMHYYNLQKENRLIELPCAVGDTVWEILTIPVEPDYLKERYIIWEMTFELSSLEDIGEWVFLTKEEAEAKLEELKGASHEPTKQI